MFLSYYGLDRDLFKKEISEKEAYKSSNYKEMMSRLEYIKEIKGIGFICRRTWNRKDIYFKMF